MEGFPTDTPAEQQIVPGSERSALSIFFETYWHIQRLYDRNYLG